MWPNPFSVLPYFTPLPTLFSALYAHQQMQSNPGYDYYPLGSPFGDVPLAPMDFSFGMVPEDAYVDARNLTQHAGLSAGWEPAHDDSFGYWSHGYEQGGEDYNSVPEHHMDYGYDFGPWHGQLGQEDIPMPQLQAPANANPENMGPYYQDPNGNYAPSYWDHLTNNYPQENNFVGAT